MLTVVVSTLRSRWVTLTGTFVALALGVALIATMGLGLAATLHAPGQHPERLAGAAVVVRGPDEVRIGDRSRPLAQPPGVPAEVVRALAAAAPTTVDRSFPLSDGLTGHPWSIAADGGYRITAGRPPRRPDEVVVAGGPADVGTVRSVRTPAGSSSLTVAGVVPPSTFEQPMFFLDSEAAKLSPRVDNVAVRADPEVVRRVVAGSAGVQVLTGDDRRRADPDPDRDREALVTMNALLGTSGGVTTFVSVFVVASTFAFAVAQRRREIGLIRMAGATPGQVRRMLFTEATAVGVVASVAGCALGAVLAPRLARLLVDERLAPAWFTIGDDRWPFHVAFWTGLLVALAGVTAATFRAGRIRPVEALREAAVDSRPMTAGRWVFGTGLLATGLGLLAWRLLTDPGDALHRKTYTTQPMLLITAVALLAPVVVGPLVRLITLLPARLPGATGMLVRENAAAGVRRTAAVAAPVLVTIALAGSLLGATATIGAAKAAELHGQVTADLIVQADGPGFDDAALARVRGVPGADVLAIRPTAVNALETRSDAEAVEPRDLGLVRDLPVRAGRIADLDDNSIVVNDEWAAKSVGQRVDIWLGDGTKRSLRVAAVLRVGTGSNGVYLTPHNAAGARPDRLEVKWRAGADASAGEAAMRAAVRPAGATVMTRAQWLEATSPQTKRQTRVGFFLVLGIALVYTGIALANTMIMATTDRLRDLTVLRLAGATRRQIRTLVAVEALTVVAVGAVLGLAVAVMNLAGIWGALATLSVWSAIVLPWSALGLTLAACAVVAVAAAVLPVMAKAQSW